MRRALDRPPRVFRLCSSRSGTSACSFVANFRGMPRNSVVWEMAVSDREKARSLGSETRIRLSSRPKRRAEEGAKKSSFPEAWRMMVWESSFSSRPCFMAWFLCRAGRTGPAGGVLVDTVGSRDSGIGGSPGANGGLLPGVVGLEEIQEGGEQPGASRHGVGVGDVLLPAGRGAAGGDDGDGGLHAADDPDHVAVRDDAGRRV